MTISGASEHRFVGPSSGKRSNKRARIRCNVVFDGLSANLSVTDDLDWC